MRLGINVFIRCFLFGLSASSSAVGHDTKQVSVGDDDMARRISAPTLVTNGERRPEFFYHIVDIGAMSPEPDPGLHSRRISHGPV